MTEVRPMPVPSPALERFEALAKPLVESGRYADAGAVLAAAMDALLREERSDEAKEAWLDQALADGDASGVYEGDVFADIRTRLGLPQRVRT